MEAMEGWSLRGAAFEIGVTDEFALRWRRVTVVEC